MIGCALMRELIRIGPRSPSRYCALKCEWYQKGPAVSATKLYTCDFPTPMACWVT